MRLKELHTNRQLKKQKQEAANILQQSMIARSEEDDECKVVEAMAERQEGQVIAEFMLPSSLGTGTGLTVGMVEDVRDADIDVEATCLLPSSGVSDCNASIRKCLSPAFTSSK
ncbi:hypothetical protein MRX96_059058 [Rhipicephalus microplus]